MSGDGRTHLSVVIPTFNRSAALSETVTSVLASDLDEGVRSELIIVDDGSEEPAANALVDVRPPPEWSLHVVRQDNAGVGAARNRGHREAVGDVIVFVDDDMLLFPETLRRHLDGHRRRPGSVIFGRSPYVGQDVDPFVEWVQGLDNDPSQRATEEFVRVTVIASGHLSIERDGPVARWHAIYADDMRTPVAEEYELSARLAAHRIPAYVARDIVAFHNRRITVEAFLRQQLGHGRGCAEAARLHPECLRLSELRTIIDHHARRSARRTLWSILGTVPARSVLQRAALAGQHGRLGPLAPWAFRLSAGAWFAAGVRSGVSP
jgi:glycosyltransferase involved in cell wall biosynthesis